MPGLKECLLPAFMFGFKNSISFCVYFLMLCLLFPLPPWSSPYLSPLVRLCFSFILIIVVLQLSAFASCSP